MSRGSFTFNIYEGEIRKIQTVYKNMLKLSEDSIVRRAFESSGKLMKERGKYFLKSRLLGHGKMVRGHYTANTMRLYNSLEKEVAITKLRVYAGFKRPLGNHAHLVDRGTKQRYTLKGYKDRLGRYYAPGQYRGKMPANKFWRSTIETFAPQLMEKLMDAIDRALTRTFLK